MKRLLTVLLLLISSSVFAGSNSSPGFYYGFKPTAGQWNSYFAGKLDYTAGSQNTIPYWDASGNFLNAAISGDCTSIANVFTCTKTNGQTYTSLFASPPQIGTVTPATGNFTSIGAMTPGTGYFTTLTVTGAIYTSAILPSWNISATSSVAASGYSYAINTSSVPVTITLPASSANSTVTMLDYAGTFSTHNLTIQAPSGVNINGASGTPATLTVSTSWIKVICTYLDATIGYRCYQ